MQRDRRQIPAAATAFPPAACRCSATGDRFRRQRPHFLRQCPRAARQETDFRGSDRISSGRGRMQRCRRQISAAATAFPPPASRCSATGDRFRRQRPHFLRQRRRAARQDTDFGGSDRISSASAHVQRDRAQISAAATAFRASASRCSATGHRFRRQRPHFVRQRPACSATGDRFRRQRAESVRQGPDPVLQGSLALGNPPRSPECGCISVSC